MLELRNTDRRPFFAEASLQDGELILLTANAEAILYGPDGTPDYITVDDFVLGPAETVQAVVIPDLTAKENGTYELLIAWGAQGDDDLTRSYSVSYFFQIVSRPALYPGIYAWVWELLGKTPDELSPARIDLYADNIIARLQDTYTDLGAYVDMSATDRKHFDEGVGHAIAARMRPGMGKDTAIGDVIRVHTQNTHFQFSDTLKQGGLTIEQQWINASIAALSRVSVIAPTVVARRTAPMMFSPTGPTRTLLNAGRRNSYLTGLVKLFADAEADFTDVVDTTGWTGEW